MFAVVFPPADCSVVTASTPHDAPLHPLPDNAHVRACDGFEPGTGVIVAVIVAAAATSTLAGADSSSLKLLVIVSFTDPACEGSATLCAVRVTSGTAG